MFRERGNGVWGVELRGPKVWRFLETDLSIQDNAYETSMEYIYSVSS